MTLPAARTWMTGCAGLKPRESILARLHYWLLRQLQGFGEAGSAVGNDSGPDVAGRWGSMPLSERFTVSGSRPHLGLPRAGTKASQHLDDVGGFFAVPGTLNHTGLLQISKRKGDLILRHPLVRRDF